MDVDAFLEEVRRDPQYADQIVYVHIGLDTSINQYIRKSFTRSRPFPK